MVRTYLTACARACEGMGVHLDDVWRLDATAQAELLRRGEVSAAELCDAAIARVEALNPRINAVVTPLYERARSRAQGPLSGPFAGVPVLVKDACLEIEGTPYYLGTAALREIDWRSARTTELARRLERAGFVIIGKANAPALSAGITTEPSAFGPTRNPWDLERSTGGSSGGSAAAVASGMVAIAHGSDGTGSLRYPASLCGVVTLKPSRGRVPSEPPAGQGDALGVWAEFVLARSVRDLAGALAVLGDAAPRTRAAAPAGRRTGVLRRDVMTGMPVEDECVAAVDAAAKALASAGYDVEERHPPSLEGSVLRTAPAIARVGLAARLEQVRWLERIVGRNVTWEEIDQTEPEGALEPNEEDVAAATAAIRAESDALDPWFRDACDVLVTPVARQPAWPLGSDGGARLAGVFPAPFSFGGQPAMSVPLHWTAGGLPVGVQLIAAHGRDEFLLGVAADLEAAMAWAGTWPAVADLTP